MRPFVGISVLGSASTVVLAGMLAGAGCTVTNDGSPDDAGPYDGTTDGASPVCATCLSQACTGQWAACFDDPACLAVAKRASAAACVAPDGGAIDGGADPLALYGAFASCSASNAAAGQTCATDCTGAPLPAACSADGGVVDSGASDDASGDGASDAETDAESDASASTADAGDGDAAADAGTVPVDPVVACSTCIANECGDPKKACAIGSECAAYLECAFAAADPAAAEECGRQHATGKTAAAELATCTRVGCSIACGF